MTLKKILCILTCLVLCIAFVACNVIPETPDQGKTNYPQYTEGDIPDENEVQISEPETTEHDFALTSQSNGTLTYKCLECGEEESVTIACESGTENAYTVKSNTITFCNITEKSVYDINGAFHGNIVIDVTEDYKFELQLSGLEIYSYTACPIAVVSCKEATLSAKKSTENYVYDMREAVDDDDDAISASVYATCDFNIEGKGSLNVKSINNNGIHTKDDLNVKNLSLQVDCKDNALKGNDSVSVESGNLILIARSGDAIKTKNSDVSSKGNQRGTVAIKGGNILIYAACDGIDAAYDVNIDESEASVNLQIFTDKYSKYSQEVTAVSESVYYIRFNSTDYKYSLKFFNDETDAIWQNSSTSTTAGSYRYFKIAKPSGYAYVQLYVYNSSQQQGQDKDYVACTQSMAVNNNYDTIALQSRGNSLTYGWTNYTTSSQGSFGHGGFGGMNDGNTDKGNYSTKGIKADNAIAISAGIIAINAYDDTIHANSDVVLENGATPLGNVTISGGNLTLRSNDDGIHADGKVTISGGKVDIIGSYEGIEGNTVEIADGNVSVISLDDGINGTATSGTTITISGGKLYVCASGDGVDSNSLTSYEGICFAGGSCVIISLGQSDSSIDTERGYKYLGGLVIGICKSGGMSSEATNCYNFSAVGTSKTLSLQKDAYLVVSDVVTVKMPAAINAIVVCLGKVGASISSSSSTSGDLDANGVYWNL